MISSPFFELPGSMTSRPGHLLTKFSSFKNELKVNVLALLLCSKSQRLFLLPAESEVTRGTAIFPSFAPHGGCLRVFDFDPLR